MPTALTPYDIRFVDVRLKDGRMTKGYIGTDGKLYVDDETTPPPSGGGSGSATAEETESGASSGSGASKGQDEMDGTPQVMPDVTDKNFVAQLNSVLRDNKYDRVVRHRTRGKLDMKGLPRAEMHREDVFKKKQERKNRSYNVLVLVDESGSMAHNNRERRAAEASRFLTEHLLNVEGVQVAVMGFNHVNTLRKKFTDKPLDNYAAMEQAIIKSVHSHEAGCNHDYMAVEEAFKVLSRQDEGQNFLLYLSDGEPAGCEGSNDPTVIANFIRSNHGVTTIGIGIQHDPQQIPSRIVIQDTDELKSKMLNALRAQIRRG